MKKILLSIFILIFTACSSNQFSVATIRIKGSDTMLKLTELLAEEFMKVNPGVSVYVSGGGTKNGIKALTRNEVDICTASRPLKSDEVKMIADNYGSLGMNFLVAKDALSIYLNPDNPVKNLTMQQLKDIFTGKITNWNEVGGEDSPILTIIRSTNSGTHLYFKDHVLNGEDYANKAIVKTTTNSVVEEILQHENAIGYGGMGLGKEITHASINGIKATREASVEGAYPISRYLQFYTLKEPRGAVKEFIDFVTSSAGQHIVEEQGFIPLWKLTY
jgi:phosphate transport system substrate-binding protein